LALALRVWGLQDQSLTMDEVTELRIAKQSFNDIVRTPDGFPPLYHLLLDGWLQLFGTDTSARWLSLVIGLLTIPVMWRLGLQVGGPLVGWGSALLLAISPLHVWYSQEGRAYALYLLWAALTIWIFFRARSTDEPRDWAWYGGAVLGGLYTHYAFALLLVALAAIVFAEPAGWVRLRRLALTHAAIAVLALPWAWLALADVSVQMAWPEIHPRVNLSTLAYALFSLIAGHSVGPSLRELHTVSAADAIRETLPWAVAPGVACAYLIWLAIRNGKTRPRAWSLILLTTIPLAICLILGALSPLGFRARYVAWCAIPLLVLIAIGMVRGRGRWQTPLAAAVVAGIAFVSIVRRQVDVRYNNEDARGAARHLASHADPATPVFVMSGYMAIPLSYYLGEARELRRLPNVFTSPELERALSLIRAHAQADSSFWLVYSRAFHGDPNGELLKALRDRAHLILQATLPGIDLYEGQASSLGRKP
jgi:uncharacterized membrane protein